MNINRFSLILCLVGSLVFSTALQAKITQSIDRQDISAGETFVLDVQIDKDIDVQPDLSLIPADFTIVSSSQYQHTQIVNSRRSSVKGWKIKLKTLKTGKIVIPAITVGSESTKPITLNIRDASDQLDLNGQSKAIYLEANLSSDKAYVQQQVIYTISLYRSVNTHYASLTEPTAENSIIEKLGDDIQFEKNIGNKRYLVTQRKYAVFPQQSGQLEISPITFTADVNDNNRRRSLFLNSTRPVSISTKPAKVEVKPKPANAGTPWLPAEKVILADKWTPNTDELKVGEPITWTLLLSVHGLSESQLPEMHIPDISGLHLYPDTPKKERQVDENGIMGQRIEKFAVIPSVQGEITIPEIKLTWWNTKTDSPETAILPSRTFNVLPGAAVAQTPISSQPLPITPQESVDVINDPNTRYWQMSSVAFFLLWIITLIAYFNKRTSSSRAKASIKPDQTSPSMSEKLALQNAKAAIKAGDNRAIESSLIQLVNIGRVKPINSLGSLSKLLTEQELIKKLNALETSLYSASQHSESISLSKADLDSILKQISSQRRNKASQGIPPLYAR